MTRGSTLRLPARTEAIAFIVTAAVVIGCTNHESSAAQRHTSDNAALNRTIQPTAPKLLWSRGGSPTDSAFASPSLAAADERFVYVIDAGTRRLQAFRATDGTLAWQTSPGEQQQEGALAHPGAISVVPGGGVAVVDEERRAVQFFDQAGHPGPSIELFKLSPVQALCVLRDSSVLVSGAPGPTALATVNRAGRVMQWVAVPWPDLHDAPRIRTQASLASDGANACALTLSLGRGFAVYTDKKFAKPSNYVEWFDVPTISTRRDSTAGVITTYASLDVKRIAARDAILRAHEVWVPFQGTSDKASRLVDVYDRESGDYRHSMVLPYRITSAAANKSALFIITVRAGYPALAAFDISDR